MTITTIERHVHIFVEGWTVVIRDYGEPDHIVVRFGNEKIVIEQDASGKLVISERSAPYIQ